VNFSADISDLKQSCSRLSHCSYYFVSSNSVNDSADAANTSHGFPDSTSFEIFSLFLLFSLSLVCRHS